MTDIDVNYIHHCGDDLAVVNAARVSLKKHMHFPPIATKMKDKEVNLIKFLARNKHYTPFKHQFITMRIKAPIFVARQLVKHEYMPWNEISGRYVEFDEELYWPDEWRAAAPSVKQGSHPTDTIDLKADPMVIHVSQGKSSRHSFDETLTVSTHNQITLYRELLNRGVSKEQARMVLPLNLMTEWYWSGVLFSWVKMCSLRLDSHAQKETRIVAEKAYDILLKHYPVSAPCLLDSLVRTDEGEAH